MVTQVQFQQIMKEYDRKQWSAKEKHEQSMQELYMKLPILKSINEEISQSGLKILKIMADNLPIQEKEIQLQRLEKCTLSLKQKRLDLLKQYDYTEAILSPVYECPVCKDTGFIEQENHIKEKCICLKNRINEIAFRQSNLHKLDQENFSTFNLNLFRKTAVEGEDESPFKNMNRIIDIAETFVERFDRTYLNFIFIGQAGRGKTFLCNCIANELLSNQKSVLYFTANELMELFSRIRFSNNPQDAKMHQELLDQVYQCDLLILDDLGTEMQTAFSGADMFNVINTRMNKRKMIIISTNLSINSIKKMYSDRIASRLSGKDFVALQFYGDDLRERKNPKMI